MRRGAVFENHRHYLENFMPKIALVTGANKGIGLETVRQLAREGVQVILASRDAVKGAAAASKLKAEGLAVEALSAGCE